MWNMDKTGISNVQSPSKIVARRGTEVVEKMNSGERAESVTVICSTNAAGTYSAGKKSLHEK